MDMVTIVVGTILICAYLLIPGLALSLAIFPRKKDIDMTERVGISVFLGLMTTLVQYFNDKNLFIPINTTTTAATIIGLTLAGLAIWQIRLRMTGAVKIEPAAGEVREE